MHFARSITVWLSALLYSLPLPLRQPLDLDLHLLRAVYRDHFARLYFFKLAFTDDELQQQRRYILE